MLLPLLAVAVIASLGVAAASYWLGDRWGRQQVALRYQEIETTLSNASFPLTPLVVKSIADLTGTELITVDENRKVLQSSLSLPAGAEIENLVLSHQKQFSDQTLSIVTENYQYSTFVLRASTQDSRIWVAVLFNESDLREARWRMASFPLLAGLSTIILLTSVTLLVASRLVRRLSKLQECVGRISTGEFTAAVPNEARDEVGMLGVAVTRMSEQLLKMQSTLQRQQGEKVLHQVAGGLAHQLRNSITGARMAIELHQQCCELEDDTLDVALGQLEETEAHVRRLLTVASGKTEQDAPEQVMVCLEDSIRTLHATAKHLRIELESKLDPLLADMLVKDGPSLHAALSNLVLNAMYEGSRVSVECYLLGDHDGGQRSESGLTQDAKSASKSVGGMPGEHSRDTPVLPNFAVLTVCDNGTGPPEEVADEIFDPFVTSKPEGLGLGLPVVARCARRLNGSVQWDRVGQQTRFIFKFGVTAQHEKTKPIMDTRE